MNLYFNENLRLFYQLSKLDFFFSVVNLKWKDIFRLELQRLKFGISGTSLVVQWFRLCRRSWFDPWSRELRSHRLKGVAKKKKVGFYQHKLRTSH